MFSSGPLGDPKQSGEENAVWLDGILPATGAREHRLFPGRLDKNRLSFGERAVIIAVRAPEGDFREWDEIKAWAETIADTLNKY